LGFYIIQDCEGEFSFAVWIEEKTKLIVNPLVYLKADSFELFLDFMFCNVSGLSVSDGNVNVFLVFRLGVKSHTRRSRHPKWEQLPAIGLQIYLMIKFKE